MHTTGTPAGFVLCKTSDGQFADMVGPLYVRENEEDICYGFRAEARHGNARGLVHGGLLMTLADRMLLMTVMRAVGDAPVFTVCLNADFVTAAVPGDWLIGAAETIRKTRSLVFVRGMLRRGEDIVLNLSGIWKYFPSEVRQSASGQA